MNETKPTVKEILHVLLSFPFCTIQPYLLDLSIPDPIWNIITIILWKTESLTVELITQISKLLKKFKFTKKKEN